MKKQITFFRRIEIWILLKQTEPFVQKIGAWMVAHKVRFFLVVGVLVSITILFLDYLFLNTSNKADVIVEAHGMLFDIVLFGIILTVYETITDRKGKVERYREEIMDFLGWESEEAKYRIVGNIKRLNRLKVHNIKLNSAYLKGANLEKVYLGGADLHGANLQGANLGGAGLLFANLQGADLMKANLQGAELFNANFEGTNLEKANLKGAKLIIEELEEVRLKNAILKGAEAFEYQRFSFRKVMTEEQLNSLDWKENPKDYRPDSEEK